MTKKILLLSAYDARSHKLWRNRLAQMFPDIDWTQLALPPRNFNWRIRGNSLHWAFNNRDELTANYDLLIATSMADLSSLRGLVPKLCELPTIVYFHENQFAYPGNRQREDNIEPLLVPIYSALCADKIIFNSIFNKETFLGGVRNLANKLPEKIPDCALKNLEDSLVIPVPISIPNHKSIDSKTSNCLEVVWNHRWEYDKGPGLLLEIANLLSISKSPIRLHIVGENFRQVPKEFDQIRDLLRKHANNIDIETGEFGFIEDEVSYYRLLSSCDAVLSTALHDFQGLAIQEACFAGCTPLTPNHLVYPEYLPESFLYHRHESDETTAKLVMERLQQWLTLKQENKTLPKINLKNYSAEKLRMNYEALFEFAS